jgi:LemA protein
MQFGAGTISVLAVVLLAGLLFIMIIGYLVGIYNRLVRLKNAIDRSFSDIDVILKQRHDELPKLIETCKGYMQYEQKTLEAVVQARNAYSQAQTPEQKTQADNMITGALRTLFAVAEKYPDLKADANFLELQGRITAIEDKIAARRGLFNEDVFTFNTRIASLPDSFVAGFMHLQAHALFQAEDADREDVEVKFT